MGLFDASVYDDDPWHDPYAGEVGSGDWMTSMGNGSASNSDGLDGLWNTLLGGASRVADSYASYEVAKNMRRATPEQPSSKVHVVEIPGGPSVSVVAVGAASLAAVGLGYMILKD